MAPILIDSRDLIKLGFISTLTAIFVFSTGFLFGHQQAASFYLTDSVSVPLSLPEKITGINIDIEPQIPESIEAGEEIDVDQPELKSKKIAHQIVANKTTPEISNAGSQDLAFSVDSKLGDDKPLAAKQSINAESKNIQAASVETFVNGISETTPSGKAKNKISTNTDIDVIQKNQLVAVSSFTSDELNKIKYSIQVGMYGRLINAENMMGKLQAQQLDAYVSDYTNNKNEVRYNVRFGYFVDKNAALSALEKYKSDQNGNGYLVKFSVENITNIARTENIKQPAIIEKSGKNLTPETKSLDVIQDKTLPVDTISTTNVLMETQAEILVKNQMEILVN